MQQLLDSSHPLGLERNGPDEARVCALLKSVYFSRRPPPRAQTTIESNSDACVSHTIIVVGDRSLRHFKAKKLVEDALLSKLQKTQAQVERRKATIAASAERIAKLEEENAQLDMTATTLMKQLEDAKR